MSDQNQLNALWALRHSAEHVLSQAMENLYGQDKIIKAMGPATDEGFYFDFDTVDFKVSEDMFPAIEAEMGKIIAANLPLVQKNISEKEARTLFKNNPYKLEWVDTFVKEGKELSTYSTGKDFVDLCAGPHTAKTGDIKAFKLLSVAGAYWHGDEKNKMLTRIYGTAFFNQTELDEYLHLLEEAKKRDHRKLGKELNLFTFSEYVGSGFPLYTPKGAWIRRQLNNYVEELQSSLGYDQVHTPQVAKAKLFQISGHYDKYKDDMFLVKSHYSDEEFFLKPMNCPQHTQIYASQARSYRDLPIRLSDFAMLYRDEKPGELNGLARVRAFSTDDCHIFCTEEQVDFEIDQALQMTKQIMEKLALKYRYRMSTRDPKTPEKYLGHPDTWDRLEKWAVKIMERNGIEYYDAPGEASFYAPKMDLMATDALGREWQLSTVQIDFVMPERFNLEYTDKDGQKKRPVMIHRAILGSSERALMVLLEHFAGAFPLWLSPVQVSIIQISDDQADYAQKVANELKKAGLRVELQSDSGTMQGKIKYAQEQKVPYMLILGKKEQEANTVALRTRENKQIFGLQLSDLIVKLQDQIQQKSLDLLK